MKEYELKFDGTLRGEQAKRLIEYAERYSRSPIELLVDLIGRILSDDLVVAIMDQDS